MTSCVEVRLVHCLSNNVTVARPPHLNRHLTIAGGNVTLVDDDQGRAQSAGATGGMLSDNATVSAELAQELERAEEERKRLVRIHAT